MAAAFEAEVRVRAPEGIRQKKAASACSVGGQTPSVLRRDVFRGCDWEREAGEMASNSRSILILATNRLDHKKQCSSSIFYSNPRVRAESSSAESARFELCKLFNGSRASVPGNNDVGPSCKPSEWESVTALQRQSAPCHDHAYTRLRALTFPTQTMLRQGGAGRTRRFLLNLTTLSNPAYSSTPLWRCARHYNTRVRPQAAQRFRRLRLRSFDSQTSLAREQVPTLVPCVLIRALAARQKSHCEYLLLLSSPQEAEVEENLAETRRVDRDVTVKKKKVGAADGALLF